MTIKILDRYIIRTFLHSLLMWFIVLMLLRSVIDLFIKMDEFTENTEGVLSIVGYICSYYFFNSFVYFSQMGGIMIIAAAAFTVARMNHSNELTAMLASGVSLHRVVWPIIACAMIMGGLLIIDQEFIIPGVKHKLARSADGKNKDDRFQVRFITDGNQTVWWAGNYSPSKKKMDYSLVILRDSNYRYLGHFVGCETTPGKFEGKDGWMASDGELAKIAQPGEKVWRQTQKTNMITTSIGAEEMVEAVIKRCREDVRKGKRTNIPKPDQIRGATKISVADPEFGMTIRAEKFIRWPTVKEAVSKITGKITKYVSGPAKLEMPKFEFRTTDGRVLATIFANSALRHPVPQHKANWKLTDGTIFHATDLTAAELKLRQSGHYLEYMSSSELTAMLKYKRTTDPRGVRMTKYVRFSTPLNNLVMLLLGLPFILSRQRNIKASAALCILMVAMFYVFIYIARYMGLPDFWAAFLPVLIFGPVSVLMLDSIKT